MTTGEEAKLKGELRAAALILVDAVLALIQEDAHQWSERPCSTCRAIGAIIGRSFGCYLFAERRAAARAAKVTP